MTEHVTVEALFETRLSQMLYVESTLADDVLPRLCREAHSTGLRYAFERHLAETEDHVDAVRELLSGLGVRAEPERSLALRALVAEHDRLLERVEPGDNVASDLVHATTAAATEHFEMSSYLR